MKLLIDENFPQPLASYWQKKKLNIKKIQLSSKSVTDNKVRELAQKENRVIVTFDKGFIAESQESVSVMIIDFPNTNFKEIFPFLDAIISAIKGLKRKKKPFVAIYSKDGIKLK